MNPLLRMHQVRSLVQQEIVSLSSTLLHDESAEGLALRLRYLREISSVPANGSLPLSHDTRLVTAAKLQVERLLSNGQERYRGYATLLQDPAKVSKVFLFGFGITPADRPMDIAISNMEIMPRDAYEACLFTFSNAEERETYAMAIEAIDELGGFVPEGNSDA